jgi:hypothetical protein
LASYVDGSRIEIGKNLCPTLWITQMKQMARFVETISIVERRTGESAHLWLALQKPVIDTLPLQFEGGAHARQSGTQDDDRSVSYGRGVKHCAGR